MNTDQDSDPLPVPGAMLTRPRSSCPSFLSRPGPRKHAPSGRKTGQWNLHEGKAPGSAFGWNRSSPPNFWRPLAANFGTGTLCGPGLCSLHFEFAANFWTHACPGGVVLEALSKAVANPGWLPG